MLKSIVYLGLVMSTVSAIHHNRRPRHLMEVKDTEGQEINSFNDFSDERWFENHIDHFHKKDDRTYQ